MDSTFFNKLARCSVTAKNHTMLDCQEHGGMASGQELAEVIRTKFWWWEISM